MGMTPEYFLDMKREDCVTRGKVRVMKEEDTKMSLDVAC